MAFQDIPNFMVTLFEKEFEGNVALKKFMKKHNLRFAKLLAFGKSAWIILCQGKSETKFVIKLEKKNTTRVEMVEKEAKHLQIANKENIGQKLMDYDLNARALLWEYVDGLPLKKWIEIKHSKKAVRRCVEECLAQAKTLDDIKLDHGQLAGDGTNILVMKDGTPIIVDFEKSSDTRSSHNYNVMKDFLLGNRSEISRKITKML